MARRRRSSSGGGSLDSLLDTMTNVVGILVIVLVVTQLGVGEAVKRIEGIDAPLLELTEQEVAAAEQESVEVSARLKELAEATAGMNLAVEQLGLEQKRDALARLEKNLASLQGKIDLEQVRKELEAEQQKETALEKAVLAAQEEIARLKAQLESTPEQPGVAPTIVTLPASRRLPRSHTRFTAALRRPRVAFLGRGQRRASRSTVMQTSISSPGGGSSGSLRSMTCQRPRCSGYSTSR